MDPRSKIGCQGLTIQNVFEMVLITETLSLTDLVIRAAAFLAQLPEKWYKGDSQIKTSKVHLKVLSQKTAQWERQLKQHGMNDHPVLGDLLAETVKLLDAEEDKYEKRRNDRFWKLKRRVFPSRLTYLLATLRGFVEAGPQIMESSVETSKLLTRLSLREPLPLPFGDDPKYVPLQTVVDEVQSALEDAGGPQVVTLYGEPGAGKSSLAKHVALLYWDSIRGSTPCMFDGVQYIFCGRGCSADIRRLRREILSNVGLGGIGDANDGRQGEDESLSSHQSVLRRLLGNRRLLIILDDVWREDFNALTNLISRGVRSRYLITSQTRDVWFDARQIKMPQPTIAQALSILKSHAQGFPTDEQLQLIPRGFEGTVDEIISKLQCHPLSLVNVAVSMPASGGKDLSRWKSLAQNIFQFLDENSYSSRVLVNERPYSLGVSASIMLMVDCLPSTAERDLLFLIFMLHGESGQGVSQHLVRFFLRRCYHGNSSVSTFKYFSARQYLEDNSLVQVHRSEGDPGSMEDSAMLTIHSLRRRYIRQKHLPAVQNLAFGLLAGCDGRHDGSLLVYPNSEQSLAVALGTVYFDKSLMAEVAAPFQNVMSLMNKSEIPRNLEQRIDARELVESVRKKLFVIACDYIIPLLNLEGEEVWKQRARADASKEFKAKAAEILKREWCEEDFTLWPESDGDGIARFWGNVALLRDLHHTTRLRLVKIAERWMAELREYCSEVLCSCTCCDSDEWCSSCVKDSSCMSIKKLSLSLRERESCTCFRKRISDYRIQEITRTVTIISHLHSDSVIIPTIECSQQRRVTSRCRPCRSEALQFYTEACMGRAFAYYQMEMHAEAISFAHLAHRAYGSCDHDSLYAARRTCDTCNFDSKCVQVESRALMIFVKALSKDYQGAMESLDQVAHSLSDENERDDFWQFRFNADRAVLFRFSGEFSKAILNFNISMKHWEHMISSRSLKHSTILGENDNPRVLNFFKYRVLKHRGYAKYMMGDLDGSKLDTKSAEDIKLSKQMVEFVSWDRHSMFGFNRVGSLVQVGLDYSLLHFPVDNQLL